MSKERSCNGRDVVAYVLLRGSVRLRELPENMLREYKRSRRYARHCLSEHNGWLFRSRRRGWDSPYVVPVCDQFRRRTGLELRELVEGLTDCKARKVGGV